MLNELDEKCKKIYKTIHNQSLEGSQYGDVRPLSVVCLSMECDGRYSKPIATGGWSEDIKIWNGGEDHNANKNQGSENDLSPLDLLGAKSIVHEDRIMSIAMRPYIISTVAEDGVSTLVATAPIDLTAKLCKIKLNSDASIRFDGCG